MLTTIKYLGHSAVLLKSSNYTIAIDPWLEGNPLCPADQKNPKIDLIVLTHGHGDHAGDAVRLAKITGAKICAAFELCQCLASQGVPNEQLQYMNTGGTFRHDQYQITFTNALHSSSYSLNGQNVLAGPAQGILVRDSKNAFYHAGDTAIFSDLKMYAELYQPTYAFLPIGDNFTMGPVEAALAAKWLGVKYAFPIHYRTFPQLTGTFKEFEESCKKHQITALEIPIGEDFKIPAL